MSTDGSVRFVKSMFSKHYREVQLFMPDRFTRREFGFMFFDRGGMMRHQAFPTRAALKKYLTDQAPAHAYYSCAYYEKPGAPTMPEKSWQGADLIFDLDADHVKGAEGLSYEKMLERVKEQLIVLVDDFIIRDFGFGPEDIRIVFSGGRGYHLHISHPSVTKLSSHERREIVDYITGTELDIDTIFPVTLIEIARSPERIFTVHKRRMVKPLDGGWFSRVRRGIEDLFEELDRMDPAEQRKKAEEILSQAGMRAGDRTVEGLQKDLLAGKPGKRGIDRMLAEDNFEIFSEDKYLKAFLSYIRSGMAPQIGGETDEPVTSDIKRLIRLPSTLHGKTAFEVIPLTRDALDDFNPFRDAVPKAFGDSETLVDLRAPVELSLRDQEFSLDAGENKVPEFLATHLVCRKLASIPA